MHQNQLLTPQQAFSPDKIQAHHRQRTACVYLRQSTMYQVMHHPQSTQRQYALQQKAIDYGWDLSLIRMLDADLGRSGSHTTGRQDFNQLVADVSMGQVGPSLSWKPPVFPAAQPIGTACWNSAH